MDNEKIDEIGEKLDVNSSEIKPRKSQNWFKKHSFWMIHATNFVLSFLLGLIFGLIFLNSYRNASAYPYKKDEVKPLVNEALWGIISINIVNGIITIPQKKNSNLNRMVRIGIFILNFIVSFSISQIFLFYYVSKFLSPRSINFVIAYNAYKSPSVNNIQIRNTHEKMIIYLHSIKKSRC